MHNDWRFLIVLHLIKYSLHQDSPKSWWCSQRLMSQRTDVWATVLEVIGTLKSTVKRSPALCVLYSRAVDSVSDSALSFFCLLCWQCQVYSASSYTIDWKVMLVYINLCCSMHSSKSLKFYTYVNISRVYYESLL